MKIFFNDKKIYWALIVAILIIPGITFAAPTALISLISIAESIINALFPIMIAAAILVFGYNIAKYLTSRDLSEQGLYKQGIWNSLLAVFILFVIFGLIKVLARSLGIPNLGVDIGIADPSGNVTGSGGIATFRQIAFGVSRFISERIIPILIAVAVLFFMGNVVVSMTKNDQEAERTKLNAYLRWGIVALFVILTVFSLVGLVTGSLFGTRAVIPQFQTTE